MNQFEITPVCCNKEKHEQQSIQALCFNVGCNQPSALCSMCSEEFHKDCQKSLRKLNNISEIVQPLQLTQSKLHDLQINMNVKMDLLIQETAEKLIFISQYSENPNLDNLNRLGTLLKSEAVDSIVKEVDKLEQFIQSLFEECKNDLFKTITSIKIDYEKLEAQIIQLCGEQKAEEALQIIEAAMRNNQSDKRLLNLKGHALIRLKKFWEAIDCCEKAIDIDSNFAKPWNTKGNALVLLQRIKESLDCYEQAIKLDPKYVNPWLNKGQQLEQQEKYEEAIECYNNILDIDPLQVKAWHKKGRMLMQQQKYEEAIQYFDQALELDPNQRLVLDNKEQCLIRLNKDEERIEFYDQILWIYPGCVEILQKKGLTLNNLERYQESIECFDQILKIEPSNAEAVMKKGLALQSLRNKKIITAYYQLIKNKTTDFEALNNTGLELIEIEMFSEAIECCDLILNNDSNNILALNTKGKALNLQEKFQEAIECYNHTLTIDPKNKCAIKQLKIIKNWIMQ